MNAHRRAAFSLAFFAAAAAFGTGAAYAQEAEAPPEQRWSFAGPFGLYDTEQLQRGVKIYREVCSNCHSLKLLAFRNLADPGGPEFTTAQGAEPQGFEDLIGQLASVGQGDSHGDVLLYPHPTSKALLHSSD